MTRALSTVVALLVVGATAADAHQLDEYLQATRIDAARDRLVVELSLTPGVTVAPRILQLVDRDGDGRISAVEIDAYAHRVIDDLVLSIDGVDVSLALTRVDCPSPDEMRDGTGTIRVEARSASALTAGSHRIHYHNAHEAASSVYLVNALLPSDHDVTITAQHRDNRQRGVDIDLVVASYQARAIWSLVFLGALGALARARLAGHSQLSGAH